MYTIGYGTTRGFDGKPISLKTKQITRAQGLQLLERDVQSTVDGVNSLCSVSQSQFDAIVCLAYNIGLGGLKSSALLQNLVTNTVSKRNFTDWCKVKGTVIPGLVKRREKEYKLFIS